MTVSAATGPSLSTSTHFTGALVVRHWISRHCTGEASRHRPLNNLFLLEFDSRSNSRLFSYQLDPFRLVTGDQGRIPGGPIREDHTTQIDVVLSRRP